MGDGRWPLSLSLESAPHVSAPSWSLCCFCGCQIRLAALGWGWARLESPAPVAGQSCHPQCPSAVTPQTQDRRRHHHNLIYCCGFFCFFSQSHWSQSASQALMNLSPQHVVTEGKAISLLGIGNRGTQGWGTELVPQEALASGWEQTPDTQDFGPVPQPQATHVP